MSLPRSGSPAQSPEVCRHQVKSLGKRAWNLHKRTRRCGETRICLRTLTNVPRPVEREVGGAAPAFHLKPQSPFSAPWYRYSLQKEKNNNNKKENYLRLCSDGTYENTQSDRTLTSTFICVWPLMSFCGIINNISSAFITFFLNRVFSFSLFLVSTVATLQMWHAEILKVPHITRFHIFIFHTEALTWLTIQKTLSRCPEIKHI